MAHVVDLPQKRKIIPLEEQCAKVGSLSRGMVQDMKCPTLDTFETDSPAQTRLKEPLGAGLDL